MMSPGDARPRRPRQTTGNCDEPLRSEAANTCTTPNSAVPTSVASPCGTSEGSLRSEDVHSDLEEASPRYDSTQKIDSKASSVAVSETRQKGRAVSGGPWTMVEASNEASAEPPTDIVMDQGSMPYPVSKVESTGGPQHYYEPLAQYDNVQAGLVDSTMWGCSVNDDTSAYTGPQTSFPSNQASVCGTSDGFYRSGYVTLDPLLGGMSMGSRGVEIPVAEQARMNYGTFCRPLMFPVRPLQQPMGDKEMMNSMQQSVEESQQGQAGYEGQPSAVSVQGFSSEMDYALQAASGSGQGYMRSDPVAMRGYGQY